jgi:2-(1,2-epoxy-1,2-dihydrophenyl)acetyl-CoA isomerase
LRWRVCDLVVMERDAKLTLAFAAIGLIPDGGLCWNLAHSLGPRRALEVITEGQSLDASFCGAHGLTNKTTDVGKELGVAQEWANTLAKAAPLAVMAAKSSSPNQSRWRSVICLLRKPRHKPVFGIHRIMVAE